MRAPVGQAVTHAGFMPLVTRSIHIQHFLAVPVSGSGCGVPNGHVSTQYLQPVQISWSMKTIPCSFFLIAPVGQT